MNDRDLAEALVSVAADQCASPLTQADAIYARVLTAHPTHPAALNSAGVVALALGRIGEAVAHHQAAVEADVEAPVLWVNLAKAERAAGNDDGERGALDQAIALAPGLFTALVCKADAHERRGEVGDELPPWQAALAAAPEGQASPDLDALLAHARDFVETQTPALRRGDGRRVARRARACGR